MTNNGIPSAAPAALVILTGGLPSAYQDNGEGM